MGDKHYSQRPTVNSIDGGSAWWDASGDELQAEKWWLLQARIDPERFQYFYSKYVDIVYRVIYWKTLDRELAEDLTSETFLRAQRKLWQFRWQRHPFKCWLMRIAMNTVNGHRRTAIRTRPLPEDALEDLPSSRPGALDDLVEQERVKLLYETLGKLQAVDRDIFFLRVGAELQIKQIAQTLGLKVGTVKSRMNRGMEEIRAIWPDPSVLPGETQSEEDS